MTNREEIASISLEFATSGFNLLHAPHHVLCMIYMIGLPSSLAIFSPSLRVCQEMPSPHPRASEEDSANAPTNRAIAKIKKMEGVFMVKTHVNNDGGRNTKILNDAFG